MVWWLGASVSEEPASFCRVEVVLRMEEDNMCYRRVFAGTELLVQRCQCVVLTGDRQ